MEALHTTIGWLLILLYTGESTGFKVTGSFLLPFSYMLLIILKYQNHNLSGSNLCGSGQKSGLVCNRMMGMSTTVSTGMVMLPMSVFFTQRRKVLQKVLHSEWIISNMLQTIRVY